MIVTVNHHPSMSVKDDTADHNHGLDYTTEWWGIGKPCAETDSLGRAGESSMRAESTSVPPPDCPYAVRRDLSIRVRPVTSE
jgi:hypothetical protein